MPGERGNAGGHRWRVLRSAPAVLAAAVVAMLQAKPTDMASNASAWLHLFGAESLAQRLLAPGVDALIYLASSAVICASLFWSVWPVFRSSKAALRENIGAVLATGITCLVIGLVGSRLIPYPPDVYSLPPKNADDPVSATVMPTSVRLFFTKGKPEELEARNASWGAAWVFERQKNPKYGESAGQPAQVPLQAFGPFTPALQLPQPAPEPEYVYGYNLIVVVSFHHPVLYDRVLTDYHGAKIADPEIVKQTANFVVLRIHQDFDNALLDIRVVGH